MPNDQKVFSEEEIEQKETRLDELYEKDGKTEAEKEELKALKIEVKEARRIKLAEIANDAKLAKFRAEESKKEAEIAKAEKAELEKKAKPDKPTIVIEDTVEIGGKKYYTDEALQSMIDAGKLTVEKANAHATERNEERLLFKFEQRQKSVSQQEKFAEERRVDWEKVKKEYPHFDKTNPKFDPEDPLYKEANDLFESGLFNHPQGLSKAIEKAKKILGIGKEKPDLTNELNIQTGGNPPQRTGHEEVKLSTYEEEMAEKQFCRGDAINPKTNRPYTKEEAIIRALKAKKDMMALRGARR